MDIDISTPEGMLRNCWYTDIKLATKLRHKQLIPIAKKLFKMQGITQSCGHDRWVVLGPFVVFQQNSKGPIQVFRARQMTQYEKDQRHAVPPPLGPVFLEEEDYLAMVAIMEEECIEVEIPALPNMYDVCGILPKDPPPHE